MPHHTSGGDPRAELAELAPDEEVRPERRDHVVAVLVCHDGARWLPAVLTSLARSERSPHVLVAVDCDSTDATGRLLDTAVREGVVDEVVRVPRSTPYGAAVAAGLAQADPGSGAWTPTQRWVWLLHDDCAPAPSALDELIHATDDAPSIGVVGPKVRGWHDQRLLVECGVTVARGGARVTGLERREQDQGQHDGLRDVLAVGSAGMLVRRDVWDELGGFDPGLAMFRDDVDLCWRARRAGHRVVVTGSAVVHHREAASHGRRPGVGAVGEPGPSAARRDRASALHLLLAHAGTLALPFVFLRLLVGSLLRAVGFLLGKSPHEARDEVGAVVDTLRRPRSLHRSRTLVRASGRAPGSVPDREVRTLLAPRAGQARALWERATGQLLGGGAESGAADLQDGEDTDPWLTPQAPSRVRGWLARPGVLLTLGLLVATGFAVRALLGAGQLVGGALLAAPPGAGDLVDRYVAAWHDVGLGSAADAPPWLAMLALPAAVLRGQAPLAVDVVVLLAVPLAGLSAYLSLRGLVTSRLVRCWAALAYALLPAVTGAVAGGRLGTCVLAVLLPPLARSGARLLGAGRPATWQRAWGTGLLLAVVAAFVPGVWLVALVLALVGMVLVGGVAPRLRLLVAVATPVLLLGPWSLRVLRDPGLLLLEPGLTGPTDRHLDGWDLVLLHPGGPGATALWWSAPIVLVALAAVLRRDRWRAVLGAWVVALVGFGLGLLQLALRVEVDGVVGAIRPWPGPATLLAGGAMLAAAAVAADGIRDSVAGWSFGWRQPTVLLLAVAMLVPLVGALAVWTSGVDGPLRREDPRQVPAFVAAELSSPARPRVLMLRMRGGHVRYELLNSAAPRLGDRDVSTVPAADVSQAVGALVAGVGGTEVDTIAAWATRYVLLEGHDARDKRLVRVLDGQAGLRRVSGDRRTALWRVARAAPRAAAVPDRPATPPAAPTALPVTAGSSLVVSAPVPAAARPGRLVLAQAPDPGWVARAGGRDGTVLPTGATAAPAEGRWTARVDTATTSAFVSYEDPGRTRALWLQLLAVAVVVVLAMPARRRPELDDEDDLPDQALLPEPARDHS